MTLSAPLLRTFLSQDALRRNVRAVLERTGSGLVDLRRDAWGHGISRVAPILREEGVGRVLVDEHTVVTGPELFGLTPVRDADSDNVLDAGYIYGLPDSGGEPVLKLVGHVLSLKALLKGDGVSYNHTYIAERDTRVALITGGFGQGIPRSIGNHAQVELAGALAPIIGRVAMDVCVVDVGRLPTVRRGDDVVYFGGEGPARHGLADWVEASGLLAGELVCAVGLHSHRVATK